MIFKLIFTYVVTLSVTKVQVYIAYKIIVRSDKQIFGRAIFANFLHK